MKKHITKAIGKAKDVAKDGKELIEENWGLYLFIISIINII